jgi:hypothetical protein
MKTVLSDVSNSSNNNIIMFYTAKELFIEPVIFSFGETWFGKDCSEIRGFRSC